MQEIDKKGMWEGAWSCHALFEYTLSQHLHVLTVSEAPLNPLFGNFYGGFII